MNNVAFKKRFLLNVSHCLREQTLDILCLAQKLNINFITEDHKFSNTIGHLINPFMPEIGKVSKNMLARISTSIWKKLELSHGDVIGKSYAALMFYRT